MRFANKNEEADATQNPPVEEVIQIEEQPACKGTWLCVCEHCLHWIDLGVSSGG